MIFRRKFLLAGLLATQSTTDLSSSSPLAHTAKHENEYVILLHGLGRTSISMKRMEWALKEEGYNVINKSYPSTRHAIQELAETHLAKLLQTRVTNALQVHFVTHSMGGILLRQYLANSTITNLGRVVMLAPPNQGSELAEKLQHHWWYKLFTGPAGQQLGTGQTSLPPRLGPAKLELGIIAGDKSLNPLFSASFPGPNDGKVSVERAKCAGALDFLVVHRSHTWLMWRKDVIGATLNFLRDGRFVNTLKS